MKNLIPFLKSIAGHKGTASSASLWVLQPLQASSVLPVLYALEKFFSLPIPVLKNSPSLQPSAIFFTSGGHRRKGICSKVGTPVIPQPKEEVLPDFHRLYSEDDIRELELTLSLVQLNRHWFPGT